MYPLSVKKQCLKLRVQGSSLNDIVNLKKIPKTTIYYWIKNIKLSQKAQKRLWDSYIIKLIESNKTKKNFGFIRKKLNKKPNKWTNNFIRIIAHFYFDGEINKNWCRYSSRNISQIDRLKRLMKKEFGLNPIIRKRPDGITRIEYNYRNLGDYMIPKAKYLPIYIKTTSKNRKRLFLRAFFDDEGCISCDRKLNKRRVRGYQHSKIILKLIQSLLKEFQIESKIDKRHTEICISQKINLIKFQKEINFSPGIYINPKRKNSIWKRKLEKREILKLAIRAYRA